MDNEQRNRNKRSVIADWDERFSSEEYIYGETANIFIQQSMHHIPPQAKVAAYAEGEGRNAVFVAEQGYEVTAYDYAETGLRKTEALALKHGVTVSTKQVNLVTEQLPQTQYDAAFMVFGHFAQEEQNNVLNKMMGSLKTGGVLLLELYEKQQINYNTGGPRQVDWLYDAAQLLQWSKQYTLKHFFTGEVERVEGKLHTGQCFVVQVVLVKE